MPFGSAYGPEPAGTLNSLAVLGLREPTMDTQTLLEIAPHYVAMLVLSFLAVGVVRVVTGQVILVAELVVVLAVVFLYPFVVRRLGYAPSSWE